MINPINTEEVAIGYSASASNRQDKIFKIVIGAVKTAKHDHLLACTSGLNA